MGRRKSGRPIHGWIILDKPAGMTSAKAVTKVRILVDAAKAGHGGTLDPLATGVLPIALGEATKTVSYVMDGTKTYRFTVRWGEGRDTDDAEGEVTATSDVRPDAAAIRAILPEFTGRIEQVPPDYSAVKVGGRRAFALARSREPLALAPRLVQVDSIELADIVDSDHAVFEVRCGKGTYMRGLARDMARRLGTVGHITALRRTRAGPFDETSAISLDYLATLGHSAPLSAHLLAVETALDDIPALALNAAQADHLRHGRPVRLQVPGRGPLAAIDKLVDGDMLCAMADGRPVALARFEDGEIRPVRVLNV
jgi:tRNA pseudouridine55 synthase